MAKFFGKGRLFTADEDAFVFSNAAHTANDGGAPWSMVRHFVAPRTGAEVTTFSASETATQGGEIYTPNAEIAAAEVYTANAEIYAPNASEVYTSNAATIHAIFHAVAFKMPTFNLVHERAMPPMGLEVASLGGEHEARFSGGAGDFLF